VRNNVALSALKTVNHRFPGALPQAFAFRAFGAGKLVFEELSENGLLVTNVLAQY